MFNGYFWGGGRVRIPDYVIPGNLAKEAAYHELEVMWTIQLYIWMCLAAVIISRNKRTWWKTILKSNPWTLHVCAYSYHIILTLTYLSRPLEHFLRQIGWGEKKIQIPNTLNKTVAPYEECWRGITVLSWMTLRKEVEADCQVIPCSFTTK